MGGKLPQGYLRYPYHSVSRKQKFPSFPLQFCSPAPPEYRQKKRDIEEGCTIAYNRILEEVAAGHVSELRDLLEWNLYQKLKSEVNDIRDEGFSFQLINRNSEKTARMMHSLKMFNFFPFHNLNPSPDNRKCDLGYDSTQVPVLLYSPTGRCSLTSKEFEEVKDFNLREMNVNPTHEGWKHIPTLMSMLSESPIGLIVMDVCIVSACKLIICDQAGKVVDGACDTSEEMHSFRMQQLFFASDYNQEKGPLRPQIFSWAKEQFGWLDRQWVIVDIDNITEEPDEVSYVFKSKRGKEK